MKKTESINGILERKYCITEVGKNSENKVISWNTIVSLNDLFKDGGELAGTELFYSLQENLDGVELLKAKVNESLAFRFRDNEVYALIFRIS